jgi:hypothetical protein
VLCVLYCSCWPLCCCRYAALSGTRQAFYVLVEHEKGEDLKGDQNNDAKKNVSPLILFMNG